MKPLPGISYRITENYLNIIALLCFSMCQSKFGLLKVKILVEHIQLHLLKNDMKYTKIILEKLSN